MTDKPFISIIVPVYNTEKYLRKCLDSICNQTYISFEVLLIDDGSTDASGVICDEFANNDKRFHVYHKSNEGVSIARNVGIIHASGEWLTFVDSDDWLEKDALETLVNLIDKGTGLVVGGWKRYNDDGILLNSEQFEEYNELNAEEMIEQMLPPFCGPNYRGNLFAKIFRKETIISNGLSFNSHIAIGEDRLFNVEYIEKMSGKTKLYTRPLYSYLVRSNSAMSDVVVHNRFAEKYLSDLKAFEIIRSKFRWENYSLKFHDDFYKSVIWTYRTYNATIPLKSINYRIKLEYSLIRALGVYQTLRFYSKRVGRLFKKI